MPVVSLNLTDQAWNAYKQIPRGSRSRVLSAMIAQRDLQMNHVGGPLISSGGILEDLGYATVGEAINELTTRLERMGRTIAHRDAQIAELQEDD